MAQGDDDGCFLSFEDAFVFKDASRASLLQVWAIFTDHTHDDTTLQAPVPLIPPMVLQMLNRASIEVQWALEVDEDTRRATDASAATRSGDSFVPLTALLQPNWWRNFALTNDPDPAWFAGLSLRMRRLNAAPGATSVSCLADSKTLVNLDLCQSAVTSEGLAGLERIPTLTTLSLFACKNLTSVSCLAESNSLVELFLRESAVAAVAGLERIPTLTYLDLGSCRGLTTVACLGQCKSLVELNLCETGITSEGLAGLECIPTLKKLNLSACLAVTSVSCLAQSTSLVDLNLCRTAVTTEGLMGLERIPTLTKLELYGCRAVTSVSCLAQSQSLVELHLRKTGMTTEALVGLERIPRLTFRR